MDGTLLNKNHIISVENRQALKQAKKQGIEVVIATGRSFQESNYLLVEAGIECPMICANGAEIRSITGEILLSNPITKHIAKEVAKVFLTHDMYYELYTNDGTYSSDYDKALTIIMDIFMSSNLKGDYEKSLQAAKDRFESGKIHLVDSFDTIFNDREKTINKFISFSFDKTKLEAVKRDLETVAEIAVSSSGKENIEVNSIQAQKGIALTGFVEQRGISLEETMAIGDNYNDVSMFKRVHHSVAMGNAPLDIKKVCKKITDTNENHGVAKAILEVL